MELPTAGHLVVGGASEPDVGTMPPRWITEVSQTPGASRSDRRSSGDSSEDRCARW